MAQRACIFVPTYLKKMGGGGFFFFSVQQLSGELCSIQASFLYCVYSVGVFDVVTKVVCYSAQTQVPASFLRIPLFVCVMVNKLTVKRQNGEKGLR